MGLLDNIAKTALSGIKSKAKSSITKAANEAAFDAKRKIGTGLRKKEKFTFQELPVNVEQLKAMPEAKLDTPYKTAALTIAALCNYKNDPEATFAMIDFLKGPEPLNAMEKQFITERLTDAGYLPFSFFEGSKTENEYMPNKPYTIVVSSNSYSFQEENWASLLVQSSGSDSERKIIFRKKPSVNMWFLNDIQCLSGIKVPPSANPWA